MNKHESDDSQEIKLKEKTRSDSIDEEMEEEYDSNRQARTNL